MPATDVTGLATSAVVIVAASLLGARLPGSTPGRRALACGAVAVLAVVPFGALSPAGYLRGLTGDLSITTLVLLLRAIARWLHGPGADDGRDKAALQVLLAVTGAVLYPLALGLGSFDPYRLGYANPWFMSVLFLLALATWRIRLHLIAACLALAVLAYSIGWYESNNLWDYLVDPCVATYALAALLLKAAKRPGPLNLLSSGPIK
jgi:hypothetical protein